jgi:hypothetical protein
MSVRFHYSLLTSQLTHSRPESATAAPFPRQLPNMIDALSSVKFHSQQAGVNLDLISPPGNEINDPVSPILVQILLCVLTFARLRAKSKEI